MLAIDGPSDLYREYCWRVLMEKKKKRKNSEFWAFYTRFVWKYSLVERRVVHRTNLSDGEKTSAAKNVDDKVWDV